MYLLRNHYITVKNHFIKIERKMKRLHLLLAAAFFATFSVTAQDVTVDEIVEGYFENTGGKDNWMGLKGFKMTATFRQGDLEFPVEVVQFSDGRQYTKFTVQGNDFYQNVYDGTDLWSTNFASLQAEKSDAEATENFKLDINDFPDDFLGYKDKGYTAELMGTETIDGAETYKVKLTKEPRMIDGKQVEDISFYYFETEALVPIARDTEIRQGPQAGAMGRFTQSDFQEVEGLYFPFALAQGVKGGQLNPFVIESIELNPEVDESIFKFPATATGE